MKYSEKVNAETSTALKPALKLFAAFIILSLTACGGDGSDGVTVLPEDVANQIRLKVNNASFDDQLGTNVSLSGDTLVVGVANEDGVADDAGAVYVFIRSGSTWILEDRLTADNAEAGDNFGASVSLSGDTLAVGAPFEDGGRSSTLGNTNNNATDSGAVYVFTRTDGVWRPDALLKATNADRRDHFGESVALFGDTLVVGAPDEAARSGSGIGANNNTAPGAGAVYVYTLGINGNWGDQVYLKASNAQAGDRFGTSVALDGDTLAVAAVGEDGNDLGGEDDSGAAYVFVRDNNTWTEQQRIKVDNADANDQFGSSVALSGNTLAVGAVGEDGDTNSTAANLNEGANEAGAVYVFTRSGTSWNLQAYVKASNAQADDGFGTSVALAGDTLVVGAPFEDGDAGSTADSPTDNTTDAGAVYVFTRDSAIWSQQSYLKADNAQADDQFGTSVALTTATVAVGAPNEDGDDDGRTENAGAVYVFQ
ncbi:MAG: FG-GAP repeat protein [Gammaproteobacteria bacterium]|nr:FG-GAP repeat protein [Gammaproteobacteria bacterium]MDH5802999.1 FG-GAP repeat protein [Gammaproteobacteria bacterium]